MKAPILFLLAGALGGTPLIPGTTAQPAGADTGTPAPPVAVPSQEAAAGGDTHPFLVEMGARGRAGTTSEQRVGYERIFARLDADSDGSLTTREFVEEGTYLSRQARAGIFRASDADSDGTVTRAEYVENRIITDEAKAIVERADFDGDGTITRAEFLKHPALTKQSIAAKIFKQFDGNGDGNITTPEYLRVWGKWARGSPSSATTNTGAPEAATEAPTKRAPGPAGGPRLGGRGRPRGGFHPRTLPDLLSRRGIRVGDTLPDVRVYNADGQPLRLHRLIADKPTVVVGGCLTCPQFLKNYPGIEAVHRDYAGKGVQFFYLYRALAHPEHDGYVKPFNLEERLLHIAEAERKLQTQVPWIADNMANEVKEAMGNVNNPVFLLLAGGEIAHQQSWSHGEQLRQALAEAFGRVAQPTEAVDLNLPDFGFGTRPQSVLVPRVEVDELLIPLQIEPMTNAQPFYVKLRAEAEPNLLQSGTGRLYLGFRPDPIHDVHWNNLVDPVRFRVQPPEGVTITPASGVGPKIEVPYDTEPREFLVSVQGAEANQSLRLTVHYFACSETEGWCRPVQQQYVIYFRQDYFGGGVFGRSFRPAPFGGARRGAVGGRRFGGPPATGGPAAGPPDPAVLFQRFDTNQDGTLVEDEVPEFLWSRMAVADANQDGAVTQKELETARRGREQRY